MFESDRELLEFARTFINDRLNSLLNDVALCILPCCLNAQRLPLSALEKQMVLPGEFSKFLLEQGLLHESVDSPHLQMAKFPSVTTCVTIWELFAGLNAGNLKTPNTRVPKTGASNFARYASEFMGYSIEIAELVALVFRHKLAHTGFPGVAVPMPRDLVVKEQHRQLNKGDVVSWIVTTASREHHLKIFPVNKAPISDAPWVIRVDYALNVDIDSLLIDLLKAGRRYLDVMNQSENVMLRERFATAISHVVPRDEPVR